MYKRVVIEDNKESNVCINKKKRECKCVITE